MLTYACMLRFGSLRKPCLSPPLPRNRLQEGVPLKSLTTLKSLMSLMSLMSLIPLLLYRKPCFCGSFGWKSFVVVWWCGVVWCGVVWCGVVWCGGDVLRYARSPMLTYACMLRFGSRRKPCLSPPLPRNRLQEGVPLKSLTTLKSLMSPIPLLLSQALLLRLFRVEVLLLLVV